MMNRVSILSILTIMLSLSACGTYTSARYTPDYQKTLKANPAVSVVTPDVQVMTADFAGKTERMVDFEYHLEPMIQAALVSALKNKGYDVNTLSRRDLKDQNIYQDNDRLRQKYNEAVASLYQGQLMQKEETAGRIKVNTGTAAFALGQASGKPILMLVNYHEVVSTNGARMRDFAMDVVMKALAGPNAQTQNLSDNVEAATLTVGLLNAKNGDVLWVNRASVQESLAGSGLNSLKDNDVVAQEKIDRLVRDTLAKLPARMQLGQVKG